ncbi:hypothetical protein ES705_05933 [subsurface metagenome]
MIAKSFERIHAANLVNFGIVPLTFESEFDYDGIDVDDEIMIPSIRRLLSRNEGLVARNQTKGIEFEVRYELSERQCDIVLAGGLLPYVKTF